MITTAPATWNWRCRPLTGRFLFAAILHFSTPRIWRRAPARGFCPSSEVVRLALAHPAPNRSKPVVDDLHLGSTESGRDSRPPSSRPGRICGPLEVEPGTRRPPPLKELVIERTHVATFALVPTTDHAAPWLADRCLRVSSPSRGEVLAPFAI